MRIHQSLPFEIGQLAEAKSFKRGYRGAWFRCKVRQSIFAYAGLMEEENLSMLIQGTLTRKGQIVYGLEYYDYPDEEIEWIEIYQKPPKSSRTSAMDEIRKELILRPDYPKIYHINELPVLNTISEVIVVVDGVWRVGDLVDWLSKGCFWSATVTETMSNDKVKIKFPDPPVGEGSLDCVSSKDLRPSLDWSLELGWTVPMPQGSENGHLCARLIKPLRQGLAAKSLVIVPDDDRRSNKAKPGSSLEVDKSASSKKPICSFQCGFKDLLKQSEDFSMKDMQQTESMDMESNRGGAGIGSPCADSRSSVSVTEVSAGILGAMPTEERSCESGFCDKLLKNETSPLNSTFCDSIEGSVMDLEELLCRVKWLRQILKSGISSNMQGPSWKFCNE